MPKPGDFPLADPRVIKYPDTRDEMMAVAREARAIFNELSRTGSAHPALEALLPIVLGRSIDNILRNYPVLILSFELGFAFAEAERRRGWDRRGSYDPRVWSALAIEAGHLSEQANGHKMAAMFLAQAGFWVGKQQDTGLQELAASMQSSTELHIQ
jgi:hypothetical protein